MLDQMRPEIQNQFDFFDSARVYYSDNVSPTPNRRLPGGLATRKISDNQFVIAAYQASQIYGIGINTQNWALTFGGNQMRDIDDQMNPQRPRGRAYGRL